MIEEGTVLAALRRATRGRPDGADVFAQEIGLLDLELNGRAVRSVRGTNLGAAVLVRDGASTGHACVDSHDDCSVLDAAATAASICRRRDGSRDRRFVLKRQHGASAIRVDPATVGLERKVEALQIADDVARSHSPKVKQVRAVWHERREHNVVATHNGRLTTDDRLQVRLGVQVVAQENGRSWSGYEARGITGGFELLAEAPPEEVAAEAARRAIEMLGGVDMESRRVPVVLAPSVAGLLVHEVYGHALEADAVMADGKPNRDTGMPWRLGAKVGSEEITIRDDPCVPGGFASYAFDGEGIAPEVVTLVERGRVAGYLCDRASAARAGLDPNGHGLRQDYRYAPLPRMTNTHLLNGTSDPDDLVGGVSDGVYITALTGGGVNRSTGNCAFGISEAHLIDRGRIGQPLRASSIVGASSDLLKRIVAVGNDFGVRPNRCGKSGQWVGCMIGSPTVLIDGILVTGSGR
jgi:TldD protein